MRLLEGTINGRTGAAQSGPLRLRRDMGISANPAGGLWSAAPNTRLGARTQAALAKEQWDYVVLQEMSHGPITAPGSFFASVERLCRQIRENGAIPVLYATWAYQKGGARLSAKGWDYGGMARNLSAAYRRAAEENRALLADVGRRFYQLPGTQDLYAADGVHPSGQGARIAAETIAAAIQRHKEDPS